MYHHIYISPWEFSLRVVEGSSPLIWYRNSLQNGGAQGILTCFFRTERRGPTQGKENNMKEK